MAKKYKPRPDTWEFKNKHKHKRQVIRVHPNDLEELIAHAQVDTYMRSFAYSDACQKYQIPNAQIAVKILGLIELLRNSGRDLRQERDHYYCHRCKHHHLTSREPHG